MPISLCVTSVVYNPDGTIDVNYSDGQGRQYADHQTMIEAAVNNPIDRDMLERFLLARFRALDPSMSDASKINGVTIEIDMANLLNPPIVLS